MKSRFAPLVASIVLVPLLGVGFLNDDFVGLTNFAQRGWGLVLDQVHPRDFEFLRPLGFALFTAEASVYGSRPWLFHATHLALFVLAAWLAGTLAARIAGPVAAGWAVALALLYPGRMEAVAWIAAAFDLVALVLVTVALLLATAPGWDGRRSPAVWLAVVCFLAPFAKESAFAIAPVVAAWELLGVLPPAPVRKRLLRCGSALAGAVAAFALRLAVLGGIGGYAGTSAASAASRLLALPEALGRVALIPVNPTYAPASTLLAGLCIVAVAAIAAGLLRAPVRAWARPVTAGLTLALLGLLPALPYLDARVLVWRQSRFVALAGLGVALAAASALAAIPRRRSVAAGSVLVAAWAGVTLLNELPWLAAARAREAMVVGIEAATRAPGEHAVWVAGPIDDYRGAQLVGGRLQEVVALTLPARRIRADSEFLQRRQRRPVGPMAAAPGEALHVLRFDPSPPRLIPIRTWPPIGDAASAPQ